MPRTLVGQVVYGSALSLNGSSQYASRAVVSTVTNNFTIAFIVKVIAYGAGNSTIFQNGDSSANGYIVRFSNAGVLNIDMSFVANLTSSFTLVPGTTYRVIVLRDSGTMKIYVNAVQQGGTSASTPNTPSVNTCFGCQKNTGGTASSFANIVIDEGRFYERAINAAEIVALDAHFQHVTNPDISSSGLKIKVKFDEGSGVTAADSSVNGLNFTVTGSPTWVTGPMEISNVPARTRAEWRRLKPGITVPTNAPIGVNPSGLEFPNGLPGSEGTDYFQPTAQTYLDLATLGMTTVRIPYLMERMQPIPGQALAAGYLSEVQTAVSRAGAAGLDVILDAHNFGRRFVWVYGGFTSDWSSADAKWDGGTRVSNKLQFTNFQNVTAGHPDITRYKYTVKVEINSVDGPEGWRNAWVHFNFQDANNNYHFNLSSVNNVVQLYKKIAGVDSQVGGDVATTIALNTQYTVEVDNGYTSAGQLLIKVDGVTKFNVALDAALVKGKVGVNGSGVTGKIDDVTVDVQGDTTLGMASAYYAFGDAQLPISDFADHWSKMSTAFKNNANVKGYDTMNEWHDMPGGDPTPSTYLTCTTAQLSQAAITAIRATGDTKWIFLEYDSYSNMHHFTDFFGANPDIWWTDPLNKTGLCPHYYNDSDHSGAFAGAYDPNFLTRIETECLPLLSWAKSKGVRVIVGECRRAAKNVEK